MRNIDIGFLRTFLAAIDLNGFNRAAAALNKSQSTVSAQLHKVEEIVGVPLFEKAGRTMRLTPAGEQLAHYARRLVALHDRTLQEISGDGVEGRIRLAVMDDYATQILPRHLAGFLERFPGVDLEVSSGFSDQLMKGLGSQFDLVLSTHPVGTGSGERLCIERTRWVFAANREVPDKDSLPLALLPAGNLFRGWALKALEDAAVAYRVAFTGSSIATVEAAAAAGIAITVAKETSAMPGLRFLDESDGLPPLPDSEIMLNSAPGQRSRVVRLLCDHLAQAFAVA